MNTKNQALTRIIIAVVEICIEGINPLNFLLQLPYIYSFPSSVYPLAAATLTSRALSYYLYRPPFATRPKSPSTI